MTQITGRAWRFSADVKWATQRLLTACASPTGGKYILWEKQVAKRRKSSRRCKSYEAAVCGLLAKPTPAAQMYSQESIFCRSSASSLPFPVLFGATVNSGQNNKSQTAFKSDCANGVESDSCCKIT